VVERSKKQAAATSVYCPFGGGIRDIFVLRHSVMLGERYDIPAVGAQACGHGHSAEAAVDEELR
jgi:hypothetical protein